MQKTHKGKPVCWRVKKVTISSSWELRFFIIRMACVRSTLPRPPAHQPARRILESSDERFLEVFVAHKSRPFLVLEAYDGDLDNTWRPPSQNELTPY